jgi:SAM domain (Sterile alpha motif)
MARSTAARDKLPLQGEYARSGEIGMDVGAWLRDLGLGQYEQAFPDNDIDAGLLPTLTADDLRELGVASLGHRKRLLAAIAELGSLTGPRRSAVEQAPAPTGSHTTATVAPSPQR